MRWKTEAELAQEEKELEERPLRGFYLKYKQAAPLNLFGGQKQEVAMFDYCIPCRSQVYR